MHEVKGRDRSLAKAQSLIEARISIDVVGNRGSGRTAFMDALAARLHSMDWMVLAVRGVASLKSNPFAALSLSGIIEPLSPRRVGGVIEDVARQLMDRVRSDRCVILLDDWNDLDEASWGVVEFVRGETGVPLVISRLQGLGARHTPSGLPASTLVNTSAIDMLPLPFEDLDDILATHLGGPVDTATSRRIYAKCGGNVGLALALVDATRRDERLIAVQEGMWTAVGELWSPSLRTVVEMHLEDLGQPARDAIEVIAMIGPADVETVRRLVAWETLELLEERGLIAFVPAVPHNLVSVVPPLFVGYFRHDTLSSRRIRLTEQITSSLGDGTVVPQASGTWHAEPAPETQHAVFAGMLRERARTRRLLAAFEWENAPSVRTAAAYVEALAQSDLDTVADTISQVFETTDPHSGDMASRAEYHRLRARWMAYGLGDVEGAIAFLDTQRTELSAYGRILDAASVSILADLRTAPKGFEAALAVADGLPEAVQVALLEARIHVLTIAGRLSAAADAYEQLRQLDPRRERTLPRVLAAIGSLARGLFSEGYRELVNGWEEARGTLDLDAFSGFSAGLAYAYLHTGDMDRLGELVDVALSTGATAPLPPGVFPSLLVAAAVRASSQGQRLLNEKYAGVARASLTYSCALPGQSPVWVYAMEALAQGRHQDAADLLWDDALTLRDRGAVFAAELQMLAAADLVPEATRLAELDLVLASTPDMAVFRAQRVYLEARMRRRVPELLAAGRACEVYGRFGMAIAAYQRAADGAAEDGDLALEADARRRGRELNAQQGGRRLGSVGSGARLSLLTKREREVADLVASGLSSREIAETLVLSVRTVESHVLSIMRKLEVSSRDLIGERLSEAEPFGRQSAVPAVVGSPRPRRP
ncbi:LuxR family transcriptional regulator [Microbacterium sp. SORGH_AS_0888]|uniref:LuxR family transcriptional regulator n=1 Tax=Microbacterium sp. SORGH_AS_0888 TaxID=3041791 RepID=UPI0027832A50|nr:LuxR family transcriptional regulator [Microbacterium sp. SORGH_AS_0888]MDQ1130271.1 DNA-binding CsgD family transcriptional regulator/tetratricopeptide (TPR) repeat protein [Microbacterium sp. SORGH_AS_0888]